MEVEEDDEDEGNVGEEDITQEGFELCVSALCT